MRKIMKIKNFGSKGLNRNIYYKRRQKSSLLTLYYGISPVIIGTFDRL